MEDLFNLIQEKSPNARPLYLVIRGSHAYGTNIETSDIDYAGVFIQPLEDILGNSYKEQINDDKNDIVIYEIRRFLELLASNNPTIIELLNTPEDCVIYKDPIFDLVLDKRDSFLTKVCANSFGGYASQQIKKARGMDKKQNWEMTRVTRKTPLDFCYVIGGNYNQNGVVSLIEHLKDFGIDQSECGLSNISNARDVYALYYGDDVDYRGVVIAESNELRMSSIEKGKIPKCFISYNKDGYVSHCRDYRSYQEWLEKRNLQRWVDVKSHDQKIDGKNLMHCIRLLGMAREIAEGKGVIVRRPNADELLAIRRGEVDLNTLINHAESEIIEIDKLYKESTLPQSVDKTMVEALLVKIRKEIYNLK